MNERRTHIDLFSGIGGFAVAAGWAGYSTGVFCESDPYCCKVLKRHWPDVPIIPDIRDFDGSKWRGADLLTGGFPCQPFSVCGEQRGEEDDRALWKEMFRVIKEARPDFVLAENVAGLIQLGLDSVLLDLASEGYSCGTIIIPACAVNAPHRRSRCWIMAHATSAEFHNKGQREKQRDGVIGSGEDVADSESSLRPRVNRREEQAVRPTGRGEDVADSNHFNVQGERPNSDPKGRQGQDERQAGLCSGEAQWDTEPDVGRVAHGIPKRVDRLKAIGNAIVPQVAYEILKRI